MTANSPLTLPADRPAERRIAVVGVFDGVHSGHRFLIGELARLGCERGLEPLAVTFGNHPLEIVAPDKVPGRLLPLDERCDMLRRAGASDVVVLEFTPELCAMTASEFMVMLRDSYGVDTLVLGFNNRIGSDGPYDMEGYRRIGLDAGVEVVGAPEYTGEGSPVSSSAVRRMIESGDVAGASVALGYAYALRGTVVHGRRIGRTIGFPTANVEPADPTAVMPACGVYAARAVVDGAVWPAMVNIGRRPTVDVPGAPVSVEAHLVDFEGDLYGRRLELHLACRIRDERRFGSVGELAGQLSRDRDACIAMLAADEMR